MGYYWGMDTMVYPGTTAMSKWKANSDLKFTGYYLAPGPSREDTSWMGVNARPALITMGWGLLPLYLGKQYLTPEHQGLFTKEEAEKDARQAIEEARAEGFVSNTYIYLDIEDGGEWSSEFRLYVTHWCGYVKNLSSYIPSIYCSYKSAYQIENMISAMKGRVYCYRIGTYKGDSGIDPAPDPTDCSVSFASTWQLEQNVTKTFGGVTLLVDMNSSIYQDPSR